MSDVTLRQRLREGDLWYTGEQLQAITQAATSRVVRQRWEFFAEVISTRQRESAADSPLRVLDAGCGDGVNLEFLHQLPGLEITAVDYNPLRVERARSRFPRVRVLQDDLTQPKLSGSYDIILCSQVIEHIEDDEGLLHQLKRRLAPQGILILGTPNEGCLIAWLRNHLFERSILRVTDHVHFYTERLLRGKIRQAGFRIQRVMRENFFFPRLALNNYFASRDWGFRLMQRLNRLFPSQAAGYYFALQHENIPEVRPLSISRSA